MFKKLIFTITLVTLAFSLNTLATPIYYNEILSRLPQAKLSTLKCTICHNGQLNAFGKDFSNAKHHLSQQDPTWFDQLMQKDSDGDGVSNFDELMAGTPPGKAN